MPALSEVRNQSRIDAAAEESTPLITPVSVIRDDIPNARVEHGIAKYFATLGIFLTGISAGGVVLRAAGIAPDLSGSEVALGMAALSGMIAGVSAIL